MVESGGCTAQLSFGSAGLDIDHLEGSWSLLSGWGDCSSSAKHLILTREPTPSAGRLAPSAGGLVDQPVGGVEDRLQA
jgi:hypothetical protein